MSVFLVSVVASAVAELEHVHVDVHYVCLDFHLAVLVFQPSVYVFALVLADLPFQQWTLAPFPPFLWQLFGGG
jgi:ethanolamine transporter EutH